MPWVSRSQDAGLWAHATGSILLWRSSYSIGVSMPSAEWRRWRLWKISRYSKIALATVPIPDSSNCQYNESASRCLLRHVSPSTRPSSNRCVATSTGTQAAEKGQNWPGVDKGFDETIVSLWPRAHNRGDPRTSPGSTESTAAAAGPHLGSAGPGDPGSGDQPGSSSRRCWRSGQKSGGHLHDQRDRYLECSRGCSRC